MEANEGLKSRLHYDIEGAALWISYLVDCNLSLVDLLMKFSFLESPALYWYMRGHGSAMAAVFVNIRFGSMANDLAALSMAAPDRLIIDDSVNQLVNMDSVASGLGVLDAIITISNTGVHLAGGMELPVFLLCDD